MSTQPAEYPFSVRPLSSDEGGGFLITFPDLPGCISDGETPEKAVPTVGRLSGDTSKS